MADYSIYLIGQISKNIETYEWRERVRRYFGPYNNEDYKKREEFLYKECGVLSDRYSKPRPTVSVIDPTFSEFNKLYSIHGNDDDHKSNIELNSFKGLDLLPGKDLNYVQQSNIIIANMNHYTPDRPIIGTYFELAWTYMQPGKMVIGIYDGDPEEAFHCAHPFVKKTIAVWVKNDLEACDMIREYME